MTITDYYLPYAWYKIFEAQKILDYEILKLVYKKLNKLRPECVKIEDFRPTLKGSIVLGEILLVRRSGKLLVKFIGDNNLECPFGFIGDEVRKAYFDTLKNIDNGKV